MITKKIYKKKYCKFTKENKKVNYKDPVLKEYLTETICKIIPKRVTGVNTPVQRVLAKEIKKARFLALLPYCQHKKKQIHKEEIQ